MPMPMPTPMPGLIGALALIGGALAVAFVGAALNAQRGREEPGSGDSTGDNGTRNEAQWRPPLRPAPPPRTIESQIPADQGLRDLEEGRVEGGGRGEGREMERKNMMILIVILATQAAITVMMMLQIGLETNIYAILELSLCVGIIICFWFCTILKF